MADALPRLELPFEVVVARHLKERESASNTGGMLAASLARARIVEFGHGRRPLDPATLRGPGTLVLFPLPGAPVVTPELAESCSRLVLPDATWSQARRFVVRRLRGFRFVAAPAGAPRLTLRAPSEEGRVSTIEAAAAAFRAMGFAAQADALDAVVERVFPRMLHVRAKRGRAGL